MISYLWQGSSYLPYTGAARIQRGHLLIQPTVSEKCLCAQPGATSVESCPVPAELLGTVGGAPQAWGPTHQLAVMRRHNHAHTKLECPPVC